MKRTKVRKGLAVVLALLVALAVALPFTQQVQAAGTRTIYVVVEQNLVTTDSDGSKTTSVRTSNYDKKGRLKSTVYNNDGYTDKTVYSYDKKNRTTSIKDYSDGKMYRLVSFKYNKKGRETDSKDYAVTDGKKVLLGTTTYTYWKNGNRKKSVYKAADGSYTTTATYSKKGILKKSVGKSDSSKDTYTYDSKGNLKKIVHEGTAGDVKYLLTTTYTYKYDKKGNLVKSTSKMVEKSNGKTVATSTNTSTYKNTYKKGRLVKQVEKYTHVNKSTDGVNTIRSESKTVTTFKYKKIKVSY